MNYEEIKKAQDEIFEYNKILKIETSLDDHRRLIREEIETVKNETVKNELLKLHKKLLDAHNHIVAIQVEINKATLKN